MRTAGPAPPRLGHAQLRRLRRAACAVLLVRVGCTAQPAPPCDLLADPSCIMTGPKVPPHPAFSTYSFLPVAPLVLLLLLLPPIPPPCFYSLSSSIEPADPDTAALHPILETEAALLLQLVQFGRVPNGLPTNCVEQFQAGGAPRRGVQCAGAHAKDDSSSSPHMATGLGWPRSPEQDVPPCFVDSISAR